MDKEGTCPDCSRLHGEDQPCPKKVATVLVTHQGLRELTEVESLWLEGIEATLPSSGLVGVVEEILSTEGDFRQFS